MKPNLSWIPRSSELIGLSKEIGLRCERASKVRRGQRSVAADSIRCCGAGGASDLMPTVKRVEPRADPSSRVQPEPKHSEAS